jgi:hypothetical protein
MGFCSSCGTALKPGAKFCSGCGTAIGEFAASSLHAPTSPHSSRLGQSIRVAAIAVAVALVLGLGGVGVWQSDLVERYGGSAGEIQPSSDELAAIASCVAPYKAALMMQRDGGDMTEPDLQRQARADCAAMSQEQRAVYGEATAVGTPSRGNPDPGEDQIARLDITTISHPFSDSSCIFPT